MADNDVERVTPEKTFNSLLGRFHKARKQGRSIAGEIGQEIKDAVEKHHLHKGAFALFAKLDGMDEMKRNDFLRSFDIYRERAEGAGGKWDTASDIVDRAQQPSDEEREQAEADKVAAEQTATNVRRLRGGIKKKTEDEKPVVGMPGAPAADAPVLN